MALQRMLLGMEAVVPTSISQTEPPLPSPSQMVTWSPTTEQKFTPWKLPQNSWLRKTATSRILSCSLTPCLLLTSASHKWPHWPLHPAATQQPVYAVKQQQSSAQVGASTCWHCQKRDCRQTGKGSSKTPSTPPLHLIQRSQNPSETEAKQKSAWRLKNNGYDPQKDQINTLDRRTQIIIFHLCTGHCGQRKHLKRLGLADSAHCDCGSDSEEQTPEHILQTCPHLETVHQQFWSKDTDALEGSCWTTSDIGLLGSYWPEDLAPSSHRTQKKKKGKVLKIGIRI